MNLVAVTSVRSFGLVIGTAIDWLAVAPHAYHCRVTFAATHQTGKRILPGLLSYGLGLVGFQLRLSLFERFTVDDRLKPILVDDRFCTFNAVRFPPRYDLVGLGGKVSARAMIVNFER